MSDFLGLANQILDECASTNDLLKQLGAEGAPHGTWVSTLRQTSGRGSHGRSWESIEGNLFLSVLVRGPFSFPMTRIPLHAGYAILRVLEEHGIHHLGLKWPNDLWVRPTGEKVGGILCEGVSQGAHHFIVIGVGLNCVAAPDLPSPAAALGYSADGLREPCRRAILESVQNPPPLQEIEATLTFRRGDFISYAEAPSSGEVKQGRFAGLGPGGELQIETPEGVRAYWSGEVRLQLT